MKLDYTQSITDSSSISLTPASAMTGGGKRGKQQGGGYVGVSFLPEQSIGGMPNRLGYGPRCTPVFQAYENPLQGGGGKEKPCDCGVEEKPKTELEQLFKMTGGSPISQFSTIAATSSIFAPMGINQTIAIILLLFGHAYLTRNYKPPSSPSGSHRDRILGGGEVGQITPTAFQDGMTGGGGPSTLAPILMPFGPANLVAIASILLLHYFATRREKMMKMSGGGCESMSAFQTESIFDKEMKIHQMLGGHSLYRELEEAFLTPESSSSTSVGGGLKGKSRSRKMAKLIEPVGYDKFKTPSFIKDLKNLFRHYYYTIYKEKSGKAGKGKKMDGGAKQKQMAHSKRSVKSFQRIYDMIAPIAVALKLRKQQRKQKRRMAPKSK